MLERGLHTTAILWEPIERVYGWIHAAARILDNPAELDGAHVRRRYQGLLGAMRRWHSQAGQLEPAMAHFLKVTRSYWPGLFHCYAVPDLPRTNNDLEHLFGSHRHHERRISGRKKGSSALVLRGPVRIIAASATRLRPFSAADLAPQDPQAWRTLRAELDGRHQQRLLQCRFRRDPEAYLADLEDQVAKLVLPP
jgi:hypothetical protein